MKRVDRKRLEALTSVRAIAAVLAHDFSVASKCFEQEALRFTPGEQPFEISYWGKTATRTFLSFVDGFCFAMRAAVLDFAADLGVGLTEKERLKLQERRLTKDGTIVPANLSSLESLKLAFRHFPSLFGVDFKLDTGGEYWKALLALADIRNEITHPETLDDLTGMGIPRFWIPAYTWFRARLLELFSRCSEVLPVHMSPLEMSSIPSYKFEARLPTLFSDTDRIAIGSSSLKSLNYTEEGFKILRWDTLRAMKFASELADLDSLNGPHGQFGLRNWVRTFISEVEGTTSIAAFFIRSGAERGEVSLSDDDNEDLEGKDFEVGDHIVRVMNIWSREFGDSKSAKTEGPKWRAFREVAKLRDKLTHPRSVKDLSVSTGQMDALIAADDWFRSVTALDHIHPDKLGQGCEETPNTGLAADACRPR